MKDAIPTDSIGARIEAAARLAVEKHLEMDQQERLRGTQARIGGTDRRVTDDQIPLSVVSGPPSVEKAN